MTIGRRSQDKSDTPPFPVEDAHSMIHRQSGLQVQFPSRSAQPSQKALPPSENVTSQ